MNTVPRKKSPRAPSIALGDAIDKVTKIYAMERCHAAPTAGAAQHMGYKNADNGTALSAIASLKYYGLLERPQDGMVAVSKEFEAFQFAPTETIKQTLITKWLKSPPVFVELLDKYAEGLPSDATLKFELIHRGFSPPAAEICLQAFRRSVDFAHYYEQSLPAQVETQLNTDEESSDAGKQPTVSDSGDQTASLSAPSQPVTRTTLSDAADRIPVRLAGGRRAWIEIPIPFYDADKERLKKQIDLLLTDDEEGADDLL